MLGLWLFRLLFRAGDGIRTREYQLGRLMPYHLATPACINYNFRLYYLRSEANFTTVDYREPIRYSRSNILQWLEFCVGIINVLCMKMIFLDLYPALISVTF
jgi:hypothetical protein